MKEIVKYLGNFGRYQAFLFFGLLIIPGFLGGSETLMFSWTGFAPDARCCIPEFDNADCSGDFNGIADSHMERLFVEDNQCLRCAINATGKCLAPASGLCEGKGVVYDKETALIPNSVAIQVDVMGIWQQSINNIQFDMMCDRVFLKRFIWSANTLGMLLGSGIWSVLSDKFGRRPIMLTCGLSYIVIANIAPFFTNYYVFLFGQMTIGFISFGAYLTAYIVFMELVDGMPRTLCGIFYQGFFTVGMLYDGLCAYFVTNWQWLQWLAGLPTFGFIIFIWLFPESIRWQVVNGRTEEARIQVKKIAKINNVEIPDKVLDEELEIKQELQRQPEEDTSASVISLFSNWRLGKNTAIVWFSWFATSMGFYGLAQNTSDLPGSAYVTYTLSAFVELPAYALAVPLTQYAGRRPGLVLTFGAAGVCCIAAGVLKGIATDWIIITLAMIGKGCISASFAIIYNYAAEIFPTGDYVDARLPIIIYGVISLLAALLDLFLPETKGEQLPETIEDGKHFGTEYGRKRHEKFSQPWMSSEGQAGGGGHTNIAMSDRS